MFDTENTLQKGELVHTDLVPCDLCGTPHHRPALETISAAVVAGEAMGEVLACPACARRLLTDDLPLDATLSGVLEIDEEH